MALADDLGAAREANESNRVASARLAEEARRAEEARSSDFESIVAEYIRPAISMLTEAGVEAQPLYRETRPSGLYLAVGPVEAIAGVQGWLLASFFITCDGRWLHGATRYTRPQNEPPRYSGNVLHPGPSRERQVWDSLGASGVDPGQSVLVISGREVQPVSARDGVLTFQKPLALYRDDPALWKDPARAELCVTERRGYDDHGYLPVRIALTRAVADHLGGSSRTPPP